MFGTSGDLRNDLLTPELRVKPCATPFPGPSGTASSVAISCRGFTTAVIHPHSEVSAVFGTATLFFWGSTIEVLTSSHQFGLILFITNFIIFHTSARKEKAHHSMEELVCQLDGERHHIYLKRRKIQEVIKLRHIISLPTPNIV
ncbi:hypothetical protein H8958_020116 [Nasalis larvatus]|uniref:Uncharacterized protein n=1 Tax=Rhinopithecus roxellana TaxID=61622 RepID=A0A2K6NDE8_RHIRO